MNEVKKDVILNIPNAISISRIALIPVFIFLMMSSKILEAFIVYMFAASTDFLDGLTARWLNQRTRLGAMLDPLGDKALMMAAYIILTCPKFNLSVVIPIWLTVTVIFRDLFILIGSFYAYRRLGRKSFRPILLGKISTVSQMGVPFLVLFLNVTNTTTPIFLWLCLFTLFFTIASGIHYTLIGLKWISISKN
jgi:cardiolipin synthase